MAAAGERAAGPEEFYASFTVRNRGLVSDGEQQMLRRAVILVAGCGSIGGAVVEPLVRLGAGHLLLAEPDGYELHNLNRQHASLADIGQNKASALSDWVAQVNPYAQVRVDTRGVTAENATALVSGAALVFAGVDVTARPAPDVRRARTAACRSPAVPARPGLLTASASPSPQKAARR
jgi:tRNA threonylcarbamoyladenosine dehydratase